MVPTGIEPGQGRFPAARKTGRKHKPFTTYRDATIEAVATSAAEKILSAPPITDFGTDRQTMIAKAGVFLQTELADGPRPLQDLIAEAVKINLTLRC